MRLADACWMAVTGSLLSFVLAGFCLALDGVAMAGRLASAGLEGAVRPSSRFGRPVRGLAVGLVVTVAVLTLINVTAELLQGYGTRNQPPPEAFEPANPEQRRPTGRVVARATLDRTGEASDGMEVPRSAR